MVVEHQSHQMSTTKSTILRVFPISHRGSAKSASPHGWLSPLPHLRIRPRKLRFSALGRQMRGTQELLLEGLPWDCHGITLWDSWGVGEKQYPRQTSWQTSYMAMGTNRNGRVRRTSAISMKTLRCHHCWRVELIASVMAIIWPPQSRLELNGITIPHNENIELVKSLRGWKMLEDQFPLEIKFNDIFRGYVTLLEGCFI